MKRIFSGITAVLLFAVVLFGAATPSFAAEKGEVGRYRIDIPADKMLMIHAEPAASSQTVAYFANGDLVEITAVNGPWARGIHDGVEGWFALQYATLIRAYDRAVRLADVSSADAETVDFAAMAASGVEGALLRVGVSMRGGEIFASDLNFSARARDALAAGLQLGAYYVSSAQTTQQAADEAAHVIDAMAQTDAAWTLPVFFCPGGDAQKALGASVMTDIVTAFCDRLTAADYAAGVYLPMSWTSANLSFSQLDGVVHWVADTGDYCDFTARYDIWQHTDAGDCAGVTGKVGLSYLFCDLAAFLPEPVAPSQTAATTGTAPLPSEPTVPAEPVTAECGTTEPGFTREAGTTEPGATEPGRRTGMLGDVNWDGRVNSSDARILLRVSAQLMVLDDWSLVVADVNRDGRVNSSDARIVLRVAAQLETLS